MEESELLSLKWSSYSEHVSDLLQSLLLTSSYTDVTLVCDDRVELQAHKIILTSCSTFFRGVLKGTDEVKTIVYLKSVHHLEMQAILNFMYLGEATFSQERIKQFIAAAADLEIKGICQEAPAPADAKVKEEKTSNSATQEELKKETSNKEYMEREDDNPIQILDVFESASTNEGKVQEIEADRETLLPVAIIPENNDIPPTQVQEEIAEKREVNQNQVVKIDNHRQREAIEICLTCGEKFGLKSQLKIHCTREHKKIPKTCLNCGYRATDKKDMRSHKLDLHNYRMCMECDFIAPIPVKLDVHIQDYHEKRKIKCDFCDFKSSTRDMYKHRKVEHQFELDRLNSDPNNLICGICGFLGTDLSTIKRHVAVSHREEVKRTEFKVKQQQDLQELMSDPKHLKCVICGYVGTDLSNIKDHMTLAHQVELGNSVKKDKTGVKMYYCDQCEYQNPVKNNLRRHKEFNHEGIHYTCDQCGKITSRLMSLQNHIKAVHQKIRKFSCKECDKSFAYHNSFKNHVNSAHRGVSYPCKLCKSSFSNKGNLIKHTRKYH